MLNKIYKNYDVNKKYAIRKFAVGTFSVAIGLLATNMNELPVIGYTGPNIVHASEVTNWQPEGNIIAQGEDGVPWELYENGYLLFKPTEGKDTLSKDTGLSWKSEYGKKIKSIGFASKVYLPQYSSGLFANSYTSNGYELPLLEHIETEKIDTSNTKDISSLFLNTNIKTLKLNNWNTSNITNMSTVFAKMKKLTNVEVSDWDLSNVKDISGMFDSAESLKEIDVSKWNTSNIIDMSRAFWGTLSLENLDVSKWNTSKTTNMSRVFWDSSVNKLDVGNWNTSNVTLMDGLFAGTKVRDLNIGNWDTSNVTDMSYMFSNTFYLKSLDINNWNTSKVKNMQWMFQMFYEHEETDPTLEELNLSNWDVSNVENMSAMFSGSKTLRDLNLANWNPKKVTDMDGIFSQATGLLNLTISKDFSNVIYNKNIFTGLGYNGSDYYSFKYKYKNQYTEKWEKKDKSSGPYTVDEWWKEYKLNPEKLSGTWTREKNNSYTVNFITGTVEKLEPVTIRTGEKLTLPNLTIDKPGYKFLSWSKFNGELITNNNNIDLADIGDEINIYAKWEKVENIIRKTETIPYTKKYIAEPEFEKGVTLESFKGVDGEKEIITTYKVKTITGELYEPETKENILNNPYTQIIYVGTKPKVDTVEIPSPKRYVKDSTREKGADNIVENGKPGSKTITTTYTVNPENGDVAENVGEPVIVNPTETIIKVAAKDKVEIIKSNDKTIQRTTTYDVNPETGEITISNVTDKLISTNTPLIPNPEGADLPKVPEKNTNDKPEYTKPISTNSPTDDNGNLILPPVVEKPEFNGAVNSTEPPVSDKLEYNKPIENNEKPSETLINEKHEYTGPLSTNTPVDENGNLILPPVLEKPEYKGGVNSAEPPVENKSEYKEPVSTNTPVDNNGDLILPPAVEKPEYKSEPTEPTTKEEKPVVNKEQVKDKELPNTNSTSILTTLISSVIGTLGLGYKSKRRK